MTCDQAREVLSAYLDGELEDSLAVPLSAHLDRCRNCAEEREQLSELSRILEPARLCKAPEGLWARIATGVSDRPSPTGQPHEVAAPGALRLLRRWRWVAAAACVGLATFLSSYWGASATWWASGRPKPVQTAYGLALGVYVQELEEGKQTFNRFQGLHPAREVSPEGLVREVGFTPLVPEELPDGFRLDKSYVLATTCCKAIELRYLKGSDLVTVFQQGQGHPVSFGGLKAETTQIGGVSCQRSQLGDIVIVNWDGAGRNMTLLARADSAQMETLVRFLTRTP